MKFTARCGVILLLLMIVMGSKNLDSLKQQRDKVTEDSSLSNDDQQCLGVWSVRVNSTCQCGNALSGVIICDPRSREVEVLFCQCLTEHTGFSVAGACIYTCQHSDGRSGIYTKAPTDCASLNRQGTLCGQCIDGHTVPAYSYKLQCIKCTDSKWGLYITFAFLPLTIFIIAVLVLRINVLSPKLFLFVFSVHCISTPTGTKLILQYLNADNHDLIITTSAKVLLAMYGIWSLDFVRVNVLPDVCINATSLQILVLDYVVAIYPLIMIAIAYTMGEIHSFGSNVILRLWRPFHRFLSRFRRHWGIQTSIMDSFVTFFFLSTTKIFDVSFSLLIHTTLYRSNGKLYSYRLYYNPSITLFSKEHLPYAVMAIVILVMFVVFPLSLLFCYQCRCCKKCLAMCKIRGETLDQFVNTFQMYYKDGSNGTRDYRWFAGVFIVLKLTALHATYALFSGFQVITIVGMVCIIGAAVIILLEPYKQEYSLYNTLSSNCLLFISLFCSSVAYEFVANIYERQLRYNFVMTVVLGVTPLVYIVIVLIHHMWERFKEKRGEMLGSLPHRLLHSNQYRQSLESP